MDPPTGRDLIASSPDDVILLIFSHLDTARDMARLGRTCKRLARLVGERGWRIFARGMFPSLPLPAGHTLKNPELSWSMLAESLTWQTRCWERRSLTFRAAVPRSSRRRGADMWPTACDAHYDLDSRAELFVWAERENVCARRRQVEDHGREETRSFARFQGKSAGLRNGVDDVVRLAVVDDALGTPGRLGIVTARASGRLDLLSSEHGDGTFGASLAEFDPCHAQGPISGVPAPGELPDQSELLSFDVSPRHGKIAACTKKSILFYDLPHEDNLSGSAVGIPPSFVFDLTRPDKDKTEPKGVFGMTLSHAKWIGSGGDHLALGFRDNRRSSLQHVSLAPWGPVRTVLSGDGGDEGGPDGGECGVYPFSLTPLDISSISNQARPLLLSAWKDGTVRLRDMRARGGFSEVFADNVNPDSRIEHVLTYGTERFLGAGSRDDVVRIFDFRWPRRYYHTQALACKDKRPYPSPPQPFLGECAPQLLLADDDDADDAEGVRRLHDPLLPRQSRCDHVRGTQCRWHRLSRRLYHRPNCNIYYRPKGRSRGLLELGGVRSLSRGSELCPHFFMGVYGGFVEAGLGDDGVAGGGDRRDPADPNLSFEFSDLPGDDELQKGGYYHAVELETSLMETGDGQYVPHNDQNIRLPPFRPTRRERGGVERVARLVRASNRLDERYHHMSDFRQFRSYR